MNKEHFIKELGKLKSSSTFLSIIGYRNDHKEISNFSINFHISYANVLKKSIEIIEKIVPKNDLEAQAQEELLNSYANSLINMDITKIDEIDDAYKRFFDENNKHIRGIKMHRESCDLYVYGLLVHKHIIHPGSYPTRNRKPLTIAKDKLRENCPIEKFRLFKIIPDKVDRISVQNLILFPPID